MCRSSRLTLLVLAVASLPATASAQFYGFPSSVDVLDDGFGVLPPLPPAPPPFPAGFADNPGPPSFAAPQLPPPCSLIIKIGPGLKRSAKTRVVYGRPGCS